MRRNLKARFPLLGVSFILILALALVATGCGEDDVNGPPPTPPKWQEGQLTDNAAYDAWAAKSPEGTEIAFTSSRSGSYQIHVVPIPLTSKMERLEANVRQVTTNGGSHADWAPTGSTLLFVRSGTIYTISTNGGTETVLTTGNDPDWSPDGSQIVLVRENGPNYEIWVISADGSTETLVHSHTEYLGRPDWAPDGNQIAFVRGDLQSADNDIWVIDADGSNPRQVTGPNVDAEDWDPSWSPNGSEIAVARSDNIYVLPASGETDAIPARQITSLAVEVGGPCWSPDGERIAYHREDPWDIWIAPAAK